MRRRLSANRRTEDIYRAIVAHKAANDGNAPAIVDLMVACHISSTSLVLYHMRKLKAAGRIDWTPGLARSIVVVDPGKE